jgi:hypothetical protein
MITTKGTRIPKIIPPKTIVRLVRATKHTPFWKLTVGTSFRVGYYSKQDGLDVIWLVDSDGKYNQTTDRQSFRDHFEIVKLSQETDLYGKEKPKLRPLRPLISQKPLKVKHTRSPEVRKNARTT